MSSFRLIKNSWNHKLNIDRCNFFPKKARHISSHLYVFNLIILIKEAVSRQWKGKCILTGGPPLLCPVSPGRPSLAGLTPTAPIITKFTIFYWRKNIVLSVYTSALLAHLAVTFCGGLKSISYFHIFHLVHFVNFV